jgi:hypothetical protein
MEFTIVPSSPFLSRVSLWAVLVTLATIPAQAFTLTLGGIALSSQGLVTSVANTTTINFNSGSAPTSGPATYSSSTVTPRVVTGSGSGYAAPPADTTNYLTIGSSGTETVTISFAQAADYFGFYGGSSDTYNSVAFYNGASLLKSYTGGTNFGGGTGNQGEGIFFNFFANSPSEYFNRVVLGSTSAAFETDNHAFRSVPEPTTMAGLLLLGGVGAWKKRRKAKA